MSVHVLIGVAAAHWLITIAAFLLVFRWSFSSIRRRFWPGVILSISAIVSSYWGLTRVHIVSSQTVNGQLRWRIDSKWFFTVSLVLGALALAYTLWKRRKSPHVA